MKDVQRLNQDHVSNQKNYQQLYQKVYQKILQDKDVADFISQHQLTREEINRSLSKFFEFISERDKYQNQDESYVAVGYQPTLVMNEGYADVAYLETAELVAYKKAESIKNRIHLISLPEKFKQITTADVDLQDENRVEVVQAMTDFVKRVGRANKGLYLYGHFGVGKTYLMAFLANLLSKTHQLSTTMLHYPTFTVDIKNAIGDGSVKEKIDAIKKVDVLILDDIGAEQHSSWVRDDVLQVILQHRMQEDLPTFFTSNFSFSDLERHFAEGRTKDETWQAKRVMERIRYLAVELQLKGVNRR